MTQKSFRHFTAFDASNEKRISFILVTKNRAVALQEAFVAARPLLKPDDELIVVDGASSDGTADVVRDHGDLVTTFLTERDRNAPHAFNKGILLARGAYIVFLFDEDRMHTQALEQAIRVLEAHPEVDMLVCGGTKHFRGVSRPYYYKPGTNYGANAEDAFRYGACANGFVIRRSMFARVGLFPTDVPGGDDIVFIAQAIQRGARIRFCRINLFDFYMTEESTSARVRPAINAALLRVMPQYCSPAFVKKYRRVHAGQERFLNPFWYIRAGRYLLKVFAVDGLAAFSRRAVRREPELRVREYLWDGGFS